MRFKVSGQVCVHFYCQLFAVLLESIKYNALDCTTALTLTLGDDDAVELRRLLNAYYIAKRPLPPVASLPIASSVFLQPQLLLLSSATIRGLPLCDDAFSCSVKE